LNSVASAKEWKRASPPSAALKQFPPPSPPPFVKRADLFPPSQSLSPISCCCCFSLTIELALSLATIFCTPGRPPSAVLSHGVHAFAVQISLSLRACPRGKPEEVLVSRGDFPRDSFSPRGASGRSCLPESFFQSFFLTHGVLSLRQAMSSRVIFFGEAPLSSPMNGSS